MMVVPVDTESGFDLGQPQRLFAATPGLYMNERIAAHRTYDVSADGERFVMIKYVRSRERIESLTVVLNWFEELKERVPIPKPCNNPALKLPAARAGMRPTAPGRP